MDMMLHNLMDVMFPSLILNNGYMMYPSLTLKNGSIIFSTFTLKKNGWMMFPSIPDESSNTLLSGCKNTTNYIRHFARSTVFYRQ